MNTNETKFCQSCGMPLNDEVIGTNADGTKNHDYCIYCFKDGAFTGNFTMEEMAEYCSMFVDEYNKNTGRNLTACEYKEELLRYYPTLKRWNLPADALPHAEHPMKQQFIDEVNALGIPGLHITNLYVLQGSFINQPYTIAGNEVKIFDDNATYWGNQVVAPTREGEEARCYGIACSEEYISVSEYGKDGSDAKLIILKRRNVNK